MQERLYLLGHPIAHSKSPVMHNALYQKLGFPWEYLPMDCACEDEAQAFLSKRDFLGINITTPYKPLAFEAATIKAASAKLASGANVLARKGDSLIAFNMDGEGCTSYLEREGISFKGALVVVCGTGPTALAILHAVALAGAAKVVLIGRNKQRTEKALKAYVKQFGALAYATIDLPSTNPGRRSFREAYDETAFSFGSYRLSTTVISKADIVINATPLGMQASDGAPFDTELLHEGQTVFDVVYGHGETAIIKAAQEKGCSAYDGRGMLVAQAVASAVAFFEVAGIDYQATEGEMFDIMAEAAGFEW